MQPDEKLLPVSQVSEPMINPSPHLGVQTPALLGANPVVAQAVQTVAEEQVEQEPGQATHPLV